MRKIKQYLLKVFNLCCHWRQYVFYSESFLFFTERINDLVDIRKQEPKVEEEKLPSQLKASQDSLKAAPGHEEGLTESEKELNPSENEKHAAGQDALQLAAQQAASEEIEREQLLNYDAKQDDSPPGRTGW